MGGRKPVRWFRLAQLVALPIIVWFAWRKLAPMWPQIVDAFATVNINWGLMAVSSLLVFAAHAILVETWRRVVMAWGQQLTFSNAVRIWCISNLAKWAPGRVWAITVMGTMAHQSGVAPIAAVGSSLLIAIVNVLAAFAVVMLTASDLIGLPKPIVVGVGALAVVVALLPRFLPMVARLAAKLFRRDVSWPAFPYSTTLIAYTGCVLAYFVYGIAFRVLVQATLGEAAGATHYYIAVYTASYTLGYLFLLTPGGLGAREAALIEFLPKYGLVATVASATVVALVSRLWLTVLELLPGLILLAFVPKQMPAPK